MSTKIELLEELQELTMKDLIAQIKEGDTSASILAVARGLLNDHKVDLLMNGNKAETAADLVGVLPFSQDLEGPSEERMSQSNS